MHDGAGHVSQDLNDARYAMFGEIFEAFKNRDPLGRPQRQVAKAEEVDVSMRCSADHLVQDTSAAEPKDVLDVKDDEDEEKQLSKRKQKALNRLSIGLCPEVWHHLTSLAAELKQLVDRPDVVELHDPNSHDPGLLCHLKAYRNSEG